MGNIVRRRGMVEDDGPVAFGFTPVALTGTGYFYKDEGETQLRKTVNNMRGLLSDVIPKTGTAQVRVYRGSDLYISSIIGTLRNTSSTREVKVYNCKTIPSGTGDYIVNVPCEAGQRLLLWTNYTTSWTASGTV